MVVVKKAAQLNKKTPSFSGSSLSLYLVIKKRPYQPSM